MELGGGSRECFLLHGPYFCFQLALNIKKRSGGMVVFWDRMRVTRLSVSLLEPMAASTVGLLMPKPPRCTGSARRSLSASLMLGRPVMAMIKDILIVFSNGCSRIDMLDMV